MSYKKTWFGWLIFLIGTLFMGVFLFASLVSLFEFSGLSMSLFDLTWLRVSYIASFAVIAGVVALSIIIYFVKKRIKIDDDFFSKPICDSISLFVFVIIFFAGIFLRINLVTSNGSLDLYTFKHYEKIMLLFNNQKLTGVDFISAMYCHLGCFLTKVFGIGTFCLQYFNIFLQLIAGVCLFFALRISFSKTVALFSFAGFSLLSLPIEAVNKITPDSFVMFIACFSMLVITVLFRDWAEGLMKDNRSIVFIIIISALFGFLMFLNPVFVIYPVYYIVKTILVINNAADKKLVNSKIFVSLMYLFGSLLFMVAFLLIDGLVNSDILFAINRLLSNIGYSSFIRFFIYPSKYLIPSIVIFALSFTAFVGFIFSKTDVISGITVIFAFLYFVFAKNFIGYDVSVYLAVVFSLYSGIGVKRLLFEGYGTKKTELAEVSEGEFDIESKIEVSEDNSEENIVISVETEITDNLNATTVDNDSLGRREDSNKEDSNKEDESSFTVLEPKNIKFIENVLPMPKPHVKKKLDYAFEPSENEMKYDYEIKDDDDFDYE